MQIKFRQKINEKYEYLEHKGRETDTPLECELFTNIQVNEQDLYENDMVLVNWNTPVCAKVVWSTHFNGWALEPEYWVVNGNLVQVSREEAPSWEIPIGDSGIKTTEFEIYDYSKRIKGV